VADDPPAAPDESYAVREDLAAGSLVNFRVGARTDRSPQSTGSFLV